MKQKIVWVVVHPETIFVILSGLELKNNQIPKVFVDFRLEATEVTMTQTEAILSQVAFIPSISVNVHINNQYDCTNIPIVKSIIEKHVKKWNLL